MNRGAANRGREGGSMPDPKHDDHRPDDVPEAIKPESRDPDDPHDIGGPQAEPTGVWRILRNSLIPVVIILALVYIVYLWIY
jgi:hypothetical protein